MIIVYLACKDSSEADRISAALLDKRLIACAKKLPVESAFRWEGKKDNASEILVILETIDQKFDEIEIIVNKLHSYDTTLLFAIPVVKTTDKVKKWLNDEIS